MPTRATEPFVHALRPITVALAAVLLMHACQALAGRGEAIRDPARIWISVEVDDETSTLC